MLSTDPLNLIHKFDNIPKGSLCCSCVLESFLSYKLYINLNILYQYV